MEQQFYSIDEIHRFMYDNVIFTTIPLKRFRKKFHLYYCLDWAIEKKQTVLAELLLSHKDCSDAFKMKYGYKIIDDAVQQDSLEMVSVLLKNKNFDWDRWQEHSQIWFEPLSKNMKLLLLSDERITLKNLGHEHDLQND